MRTHAQRLAHVTQLANEWPEATFGRLEALLDALLDEASAHGDLYSIAHMLRRYHWGVVGNDACVLAPKKYGALGTVMGERMRGVMFKYGFGWGAGDVRIDQLLSVAQVFDVARRKLADDNRIAAYRYDAALFLQDVSRAAYRARQQRSVLKLIGVGSWPINLFLTAMEREDGVIDVSDLQMKLGGGGGGAAWASAYWVVPAGKCVLRVSVVQHEEEVGVFHILVFVHPSRKTSMCVNDLRFYAGAGLRNLYLGHTIRNLTLHVPDDANLTALPPAGTTSLEYGVHTDASK